MSVSSISQCSFKGIGLVQIGEKVKYASSAKLGKLMFSNPKYKDVITGNITSQKAQGCLSTFGKYARKIELDPTHLYKYSNGHGKAQLFDLTANANVIKGIEKISKPVRAILKNIFKK